MRHNIVASIRLTAGALRAPDRFRIWRAGSNPGDYGDLFFTPRAAQMVMGEFLARGGNAMAMDFEHALNPGVNPKLDPANPPPTAGYLLLELVESPDGPELWGIPRWGECGRDASVPEKVCCGRHQIESGQRCYISPDWQIDTETREPVRLNRVSLVADPATYGINLLASRPVASRGTASMDEMAQLKAGHASMKAMAASEDPKIAKACAAAVAAMEEHAGALGMKLGAEGADGEELAPPDKKDGQASEDASTNQIDPKQAAADGQVKSPEETKVDKIDDAGRGPGPGPATAGKTASRMLSMEDVRAEFARMGEEERLRGLVAARMPKGVDGLVASMSLVQLRTAARELPAPPASKGTDGDTGANVTAGKGRGTVEEKLSPREEFLLERWHKRLGVKEANETASKKAWAEDPVSGAMEVDIFALTADFREKARKGKSA